jgi:hypothetical protein
VLSIVFAMLVILAIAGAVVLYVAYPHRGEEVPHTPWVGDAMRKGVDALPTLHNQRAREEQAARR